MSDLYSTLGVPKDADKASIRRAYRKHAKAAHPDGGGDERKFALGKLAHDVLSDEERRAKYDATGDATEHEVDNAHAEALQFIGAMLEATIAECEQAGIDPVTADLAATLRNCADRELASIESARTDAEKKKAKAERLLKRFILKKKSEPNLLEMIVRARIVPLERQLVDLARAHERMSAARKILNDYGFDADAAPNPRSVNTFFFNLNATASTR